MELRLAPISLLVVFLIFAISESAAGRHRKIIIHVPVKFKKQKHVHTVVKPVHVHHKPSLIKEEKIIRHEVHKPIHIHKEEFYEKPAPVIEYKKKEIRPIYKEEISHEHLHHHYKHVHPEVPEHSNNFGGLNENDDLSSNFAFESTHP